MPMGILQSLYFLCVQDVHGILVTFKYLSIDAILFNSVDVLNFCKTIKATKNGHTIGV